MSNKKKSATKSPSRTDIMRNTATVSAYSALMLLEHSVREMVQQIQAGDREVGDKTYVKICRLHGQLTEILEEAIGEYCQTKDPEE